MSFSKINLHNSIIFIIFAIQNQNKNTNKKDRRLEHRQWNIITNKKGEKTMKIRKPKFQVSREKAIEIAMDHNCVSREIAERYTDSELREVLRVLGLTAKF